ncbi:MAG: hypothetical protein ACD_2C00102G0002 [uncultured bacterium (gcode 4)]|uniref:Peptidase S54 rhomboid domain-containing protein n=1 Tax=uncultured bacterium (gcode 4) TaxID=1234023 RepID=K2FEW9_9BACT|nr:MAG: hypothetical protein ACD_2C00102G0002 [uncultured bacterium (gcode 4)]
MNHSNIIHKKRLMWRLDKSISNLLIILSIIITALTIPFPELFRYWMNKYYLYVTHDIPSILVQFWLYQFLHWWMLHILSNSLFIYIFWNQVEILMWKKRYLQFFLLNAIFTWFAILFLSSANTVWISWFAMAIMGYVFMHLRKIKHPDYKWAWIFLVLNVLIWFGSNISLIWHLAWAIFWCWYFYLETNLRSRKLIDKNKYGL